MRYVSESPQLVRRLLLDECLSVAFRSDNNSTAGILTQRPILLLPVKSPSSTPRGGRRRGRGRRGDLLSSISDELAPGARRAHYRCVRTARGDRSSRTLPHNHVISFQANCSDK